MLEGVLLEKVLPGRVEQKRVSDEFFTSCAELFDIVTSEGRHAHTAQTFKACFEHADCIGVLESHEDRSKQIFFELLKQLPEGSCVLFESVNSGTPTGKALERFTRLQCAGADDAALPMGLVYSGWDDLDLIHEGLEKKAAFRALCRSKGVRFDQDTRGNVRWPVSVKQAFNAYRNVIIEARDRHREQVLTARLEQLSDHDGVDGEKREKKEKGIKRKIVWLAGLDHGYEPMQCPSSRYSGRHCMMLVPKGVSPAATYIPI